MDQKDTDQCEKIRNMKQNVEALIFSTEENVDLKLLGAIFLSSAKRIFIATEGAAKTKAALLKYAGEIKIPEEIT